MAKRLMVLVAVLVLAAVVPAAAQGGAQYGGEEVSATGYLSPVSPPGAYSHLLNDEATGRQYLVRSGTVDLTAYDDGQKVTVRGAQVSGGGTETVLEVTGVDEPGQEAPRPGEAATLSFELVVEGELPANATFSGNIQTGEGGPGIFVPLTDPDGDGVYTGSTTIPDRFPPGLRPLPPDAEPLQFPVRIVQVTNPDATDDPSGGPTSVLKDFGTVPMEEENTFPASFSFGVSGDGDKIPNGGTTMGETVGSANEDYEDGGDPEGGVDLNEDGVVDEADAELASETSDAASDAAPKEDTLPNTGGGILTLLAGALLTGGGLLLRLVPR